MVNRVQTLRSSTTGNRPTGRQPGELYVNFADGQIGVVNASSAAQDLVAVTFFSTSSNYAVGAFVIQGGQLYRAVVASSMGTFNPANWAQIGGSVGVGDTAPSNPQPGTLWWDSVGGQLYVWYNDGSSSQWVVAVNASAAMQGYLPLSGGALTGSISGPSATFSNLSAPQAIGDNRIINGDMGRDQRNNGASGTAIGYTCDRWQFSSTLATKGTWQRGGGGAGDTVFSATGFGYYLLFTSNSAYAPAVSDFFRLLQVVEADMITDFAWGTANAKPVTLSFWAASSIAGTFSGSISTFPSATRSYPFTFSLPVAATWTKIAVTIPGDSFISTTNWTLAGNGAALGVQFDLGSGATFRGPAGAWASANYVGVTGSASVVSTNGAYLVVTGVKLEIGSVATPFNRQSLAKSMADCQRYFEVCNASIIVDGTASAFYQVNVPFAVEKRAAPTITSLTQSGAGNGQFGVRSVGGTVGATSRGVNWGGTVAATGPARGFNDSFSASAEL